ncbi:hypothetical protein [Metamycoplasma buccale]|uniref:hypothetical protein n=1 Tax=Metamycoplasma buccale TaxID=55602 RepID=UPI00398F0DC1
MTTFFKMQLKIFYRQIAFYITGIVSMIFNIGIALALYVSLKIIGGDSQLIYTPEATAMFRSFMVTFGTINGFMSAALVLQGLFYKYRDEGMYYVMQSKPITKLQIYFATVFAGMVVIISQLAISSVGYFVSTFFIPSLPLKEKFLTTITFYLGTILIAFVSLGLGAFLHNFMQAKTYQFATGWVPVIFVILVYFVATPSRTKGNVLSTVALKKVISVGKDNLTKKENKQIPEYLAYPFDNGHSFWVEDKLTDDTFSKMVEDNNKNLYNKIFWLDPATYFASNYFLIGRKSNRTQEFLYTKKINYGENNFIKDINEKKWVFKIKNTKINGQVSNDYFGLSYNHTMLLNMARVKDLNSPLTSDFIETIKSTNLLAAKKATIKAFNEVQEDIINKIDELSKLSDFTLNKKVISWNTLGLLQLIKDLNEDKYLFDIIKNFTLKHINFPKDSLYSEDQFKNMNQNEFEKTITNPALTTLIFKYNLVKQTALIYLLSKVIREKAPTKGVLENFDFNELEKYFKNIKSLSALSVVKMNNNLVEFGTKKPFPWYVGFITPLLASWVLIIAGSIVYKKKVN